MDNEENKKLCDWITCKKNRCRKIINLNDKFCNKHKLYSSCFKIISESKENILCSTIKYLKITPRSKEHLESIMKKYDIDDINVDVYFNSSYVEEGNISNNDYIEMTLDNSKIYYIKKRGRLCTEDIKILLTICCNGFGKIDVNGDIYCEECYLKKGQKENGYPIVNCLLN